MPGTADICFRGRVSFFTGVCVNPALQTEASVQHSTLLLVQAVCYGRAFCNAESFPRKKILETCRLLRLVNALKSPEVGICLTIAELEAAGVEAVIRRLVKGHRHLLAYRASQMLGLNPNEVSAHAAKLTFLKSRDVALQKYCPVWPVDSN